MNSPAFREDDWRLLTPAAFDFVLGSELRRALRAQTFLTLVTLEARRVWEGLMIGADDGTLAELGELLAGEVRDTDVLGQSARSSLWLVLLDADSEGSRQVIDRVIARIDSYRFSTPVSIVMGAASCPTHAVDAEALKREAISRPLWSARRDVHPASATDRT